MLAGFEQETAPLNEIELLASEVIAKSMRMHHVGREKAVTGQHICDALARYNEIYRDGKGRPYLNGTRVRKIVNFLRVNGICPFLIASAKGYYISTDTEEIKEYINSLRERANAINAVANTMSAYVCAK